MISPKSHESFRSHVGIKPEKLYEEAGIVVYDYEVREPWLQSLSYEDWRMYVFIHEKEVDALLHHPYMEKYFPPE